MEEKSAGVAQRMQQLEADQASLKQQRDKMQSDLETAKQNLANKKTAHAKMLDSLRRAG
jgi:outer membrane murein-binding lipoprotein Lpp